MSSGHLCRTNINSKHDSASAKNHVMTTLAKKLGGNKDFDAFAGKWL